MQQTQNTQFDRLFDDSLRAFRPNILLAFGGLPNDIRRYERVRRQGARIVFALRNAAYLTAHDLLASVDGILTPSQFLADFYRNAIGIDSTPLPLPIELDDVIAAEHDTIFFTVINPSPEKGLMVIARLAEELSLRRSDIPLLVVESRGSAGRHARRLRSAPSRKPHDVAAARPA